MARDPNQMEAIKRRLASQQGKSGSPLLKRRVSQLPRFGTPSRTPRTPPPGLGGRKPTPPFTPPTKSPPPGFQDRRPTPPSSPVKPVIPPNSRRRGLGPRKPAIGTPRRGVGFGNQGRTKPRTSPYGNQSELDDKLKRAVKRRLFG